MAGSRTHVLQRVLLQKALAEIPQHSPDRVPHILVISSSLYLSDDRCSLYFLMIVDLSDLKQPVSVFDSLIGADRIGIAGSTI